MEVAVGTAISSREDGVVCAAATAADTAVVVAVVVGAKCEMARS